MPNVNIGKHSAINQNRDVAGERNLRHFDGYFANHYKNVLTGGTAFVFFTKPKLFLYEDAVNSSSDAYMKMAYQNMCSDPYFTLFLNSEAINGSDKLIVKNLSYLDNLDTNYIRILTNECKNFDPSDVNIDSVDVYNTKQGYRLPLPTHTTQSEAVGQLSFQFTETANLDISKIISLWVKYIENISNGTFRANPDMINKGEIDYMSSIYYFMLGPDGHSLKYWAKYTGCYPVSIPYSGMKYSKKDGSIVELSVNFTYTVKEDMDPRILEDFNRVSLGDFDHEYITESTTQYDSVKESSLLSLAHLKQMFSSVINSEDRDPLIFFNKASVDKTALEDALNDKFELSFGASDMHYEFEEERFDYDSSIYNTKI